MVVIGGDGTLHHALPALSASGAAVYHVPFGTENLFAREFGMTRDADLLAASLAQPRIAAIDLLEVSTRDCTRLAAIMASVGPDAGVIHALDLARTGPISHLSYVKPILSQLLRRRLPHLSIEIDGHTAVEHRPGVCIVGNLRQYALRIDPAVRAHPADGLLDLVFFPAAGPVRALLWMLRARTRTHIRAGNLVYRTGRTVRITSPDAAPFQVDGEAARSPLGPLDLTISVRPAALRVLLPVGRRTDLAPAVAGVQSGRV